MGGCKKCHVLAREISKKSVFRSANIEKILENRGKGVETTDGSEHFEDKITRKTVRIEKNFRNRGGRDAC